MTSVLFVCYANICRSPLAEAIFRQQVKQAGLQDDFRIDSAGVSAFEGSAPHPLSVEIGGNHGLVVEGKSRQLLRRDFADFDHMLLMDRSNLATIEQLMQPSAFGGMAAFHANVRLLLSLGDPDRRGRELDVPDPINRGAEAYESVYQQLVASCAALLDELRA